MGASALCIQHYMVTYRVLSATKKESSHSTSGEPCYLLPSTCALSRETEAFAIPLPRYAPKICRERHDFIHCICSGQILSSNSAEDTRIVYSN